MRKFYLSIIALLIFSSHVLAEKFPYYEKKEGTTQLTADVDLNGQKENIDISVGEHDDGGYVCVLRVKQGDSVCSKAFDVDMYSCNLSIIEISPNLEPYIAVDCGAGAHSYVLKLFRYKSVGDNYYELTYVGEFFSDVPLIKVEDIDGDGIKDVFISDRDYEGNPVKDRYHTLYKYQDNDKWENIYTYRTSTQEYMPKDWDKDIADREAYDKTMKKFGLFEGETDNKSTPGELLKNMAEDEIRRMKAGIDEWEDPKMIGLLREARVTDNDIKELYKKFNNILVVPPHPDQYTDYTIENAETALNEVGKFGKYLHNLYLSLSAEDFKKYGKLIGVMREVLYLDYLHIPLAIKHDNSRDLYWYELHNKGLDYTKKEYLKVIKE